VFGHTGTARRLGVV